MTAQILAISGTTIKQDSFGRFCLNDLHKAAGNEAKHKPDNWKRSQQAVDLISLLESENCNLKPIDVINGGVQRGTYVVKELVYAYAMWISAKFHITVIRAYDSLVNPVQYGLKDLPTATPKTITPPMQRQVQKAISHLVKTQVGTTYSGLYGQIKDKFDVGSYKDVPFKRYGELCEFLNIEPIEGELVEPVALPYQPPKGMVLIAESELETLRKTPAPIVQKVEPIAAGCVVIPIKEYDKSKQLEDIMASLRFQLRTAGFI